MKNVKSKIVKVLLLAFTTILLAGAFGTTTEAACKHSYKVTKTVKATCTKAGYKQQKCKKCGAKKKTTLKKLGHNYKVTKTVKATCIKAGYKQSKCSRCNVTKKTTLSKLGHNYKTTKTVNATCAKAGYKNQKCSRCTVTRKVTLKKLSHTYTKKVIKATCTNEGYTQYKCTKCGYTYKNSVVPAKGHTEVKETVNQSGKLYERVYCKTCGTEISKTLIGTVEGCNTLMSGNEFRVSMHKLSGLYNIKTLAFTNKEVPENADIKDVSEKQDGSVVAWAEGENVFVTTTDGKTLYANEACSSMISGGVSEIVFDNFDTSKVKNMEGMFFECEELEELDLSSFHTSNVTNMSLMFYRCMNLKELDLSHFDTSNVENMTGMFNDCVRLETLNLDGFDTSNVVAMGNMFSACVSLKALDVTSFDTSKVEDMFCMFSGCKSLEVLDLNNFDVANVTDMYSMFSTCKNLKYLYGSNWTEEAVKNPDSENMFTACDSLVGVIPYKSGMEAEAYTIENANPVTGFFATYGSEGHRPNNMTSEALSMETFKGAIAELIEDYKMTSYDGSYGAGASIHPESSFVDIYGEGSVRYNLMAENSPSNAPSVMVQIVKVNDVSKADAVGESFEKWEYYSQHEHQYLLYNNGEYVLYISVPDELKDAGFTMERVLKYIDAYYEAATK